MLFKGALVKCTQIPKALTLNLYLIAFEDKETLYVFLWLQVWWICSCLSWCTSSSGKFKIYICQSKINRKIFRWLNEKFTRLLKIVSLRYPRFFLRYIISYICILCFIVFLPFICHLSFIPFDGICIACRVRIFPLVLKISVFLSQNWMTTRPVMLRGVFRMQSNLCDGAFSGEIN